MTGTEGITGTPQAVESLVLAPPMVIPEEIKNLELTGQIPTGEVAYFDITNPNLRLVDRKTWSPVLHDGKEKVVDPNHLPKTFAAIILHTPPRTPENSYEEEIHKLSNLLRRSSKKDDNKGTIQQNLGVLFIVEDKGEDTRIGWRQDALAIKGVKGLVVDTSHEGSVIVTDSHIISFARLQKQHHTENGVITFRGMDDEGHPIHVVTYPSGSSRILTEEELQKLTPQIEHQPEDKVVREDLTCDACGNHPQDVYISRQGDIRNLLFRETICNNPHRDGIPRRFGDPEYIRYLELLPKEMQKPRKTSKK
jgi:hypothetical protein